MLKDVVLQLDTQLLSVSRCMLEFPASFTSKKSFQHPVTFAVVVFSFSKRMSLLSAKGNLSLWWSLFILFGRLFLAMFSLVTCRLGAMYREYISHLAKHHTTLYRLSLALVMLLSNDEYHLRVWPCPFWLQNLQFRTCTLFLRYQRRHRALHLGACLPVAERAAIGLFIGLSVPSLSSLLVMPCPVRRQCRAWWLRNLLQLWRDFRQVFPNVLPPGL
jgi:hypothetical protein